MACICLSPLSSEEKDFPAIGTAVDFHFQKQAIFRTEVQYRGIEVCE